MVINPQDLRLFQEANGYLPRLNLHSQVLSWNPTHSPNTDFVFIARCGICLWAYSVTKRPFPFRKANQKDIKKNVYFPSNPRRHALWVQAPAAWWSLVAHSLPIRGISTPVCVFVYMCIYVCVYVNIYPHHEEKRLSVTWNYFFLFSLSVFSNVSKRNS